MSQTVANVSAAKPKVGGAIYKAPIGTTLPTNATAELDPAFVSLGYMSDAGLKRAINLSTNPIKAWGGDTIANPQTDKSEQFTFEAAEVLNPEVQKLVNGDSNVSGTVAEGMTVKINTKEDTDNDIIKYGITIRAMADEALNGDTAREYYVSGSATPDPYVELNLHSVLIPEDGTTTLTATTFPEGQTVTWSSGSGSVATVSGGVVTAEGAGNTIITAAITKDGVTYTDTCTVVVQAAED